MSRGKIIMWIASVILCALLVAPFASRAVYRSQRRAVESKAAGYLRSYALAQERFHGRNHRYGSLEELRAHDLVEAELTDSMALGPYRLEFEVLRGGGFYHARAEPWASSFSQPFFYVDSNSPDRVLYSEHGMAGPNDPCYECE